GRIIVIGGLTQAVILLSLSLILFFTGFYSFALSLFVGFVLIQSSTAVPIKIYQDRKEIDAPHTDTVLGICLFQDLFIVPLLLLLPVLAGRVGEMQPARFTANIAILAASLFAAWKLLPYLLRFIAESKIRELFVLTAVFLCIGSAFLTSSLGFSMALGAFICGIILSRSEFHHQISSEITPFRDVFNSLFFISIGMLINIGFVLNSLHIILPLTAAVILIKFLANYTAIFALGYPNRIRILSAMGLSNIGEFAFILLQTGSVYGLISAYQYQLAGSVAVFTLFATPLLIILAPKISCSSKSVQACTVDPSDTKKKKTKIQVLIVGFGLAGKHLAKVLKEAGISYSVLEFNAVIVRQAKASGEPITYGDCTRADILQAIGMADALVAVYLISDNSALKQSIKHAKSLNSTIFIIARTRRFSEIETLMKIGADEVVAEEFETSIELFTIVLTRLHVPRNLIRSQTKLLRQDGYEMLRVPANSKGISEKVLAALSAGTTDTFYVGKEHFSVDKTLFTLNLRGNAGASVIAIVRDDKSMPNPPSDLPLLPGDILVLVGTHAQIDAAFDYLETGKGKLTLQV
ncbi:MAG: cation:proton antiporter, partial [Fibrobacteres bacterium]|nr:cation:proton antiporter [Fibrobacterota bacterium]